MKAEFQRLWAWPLLLGLVTAVGLGSALVGNGAYDALSWLGLGIPVAVAIRHVARKPVADKASR